MPDESIKTIHNPHNKALQKHISEDLHLEPDVFGSTIATIHYECMPLFFEKFKENWYNLNFSKLPFFLLENPAQKELETLKAQVDSLSEQWQRIAHKYPGVTDIEKFLKLYAEFFKLYEKKTAIADEQLQLKRKKKFEALLQVKQEIQAQLNKVLDSIPEQQTLYKTTINSFANLQSFLSYLLPPADLLSDGQTERLKAVIAHLSSRKTTVWKPLLDKARSLAVALDKTLESYQKALIDWEQANPEKRVQLREHKAQVALESCEGPSSGFFRAPNHVARAAASVNIYGEKQKENANGGHAVKAMKAKDGKPGSFWKRNEQGMKSITPAEEYSMLYWYKLFTPPDAKNPLTAPIMLAKVSNIMCIDKVASPGEVLQLFEEKLVAGKLPEAILQENPELDKQLVKKYIEHVVQVSQAMGTLSLHTLLALRRYFMWGCDTLKENGKENEFYKKLPSLIDGSFLHDFQKENLWCHEQITDAELLYRFIKLMKEKGIYFKGFREKEISQLDLQTLSPANINPLLLSSFQAIINGISKDEILSALALATTWPELVEGQDIYDLGRLTKTFKYLPSLFPTKQHSDYYCELKNIFKYIDCANFSALFLAKLISGPTDDKADNSMVDIEYDEYGNIRKIIIAGIDNDEAKSVSVIRSGSAVLGGVKHYPGVKNIFNFFSPLMDLPLEPSVVDYFLSQTPESLFLQWLVPQLAQNRRFKRALHLDMLKQSDLFFAGEPCLDIPLYLDPGFTKLMLARVEVIHWYLKNNRTMTHRKLFELLDPILERTYRAIQKKYGDQPGSCLGSMYGNSPDSIEDLLASQMHESVTMFLPPGDGRPMKVAEAISLYTEDERKEERRTQLVEDTVKEFICSKLKFPDCLQNKNIVMPLLQLISYDMKFIAVLNRFQVTPDYLIAQLGFPNCLLDPAVMTVLLNFIYLQPQFANSIPFMADWLNSRDYILPLLQIVSYAPEFVNKLPILLRDLISWLSFPDCLQNPATMSVLLVFIARQPQLIINIPLSPNDLLLYAAQYDNADAVRALLNIGANPNHVCAQHYTALHYALSVDQPSLAVIETLLQAPLREANSRPVYGFTPIFYIKNASTDLLDLLALYGEKIDYEVKVAQSNGEKISQRPIDKAMADNNYSLFFALARNATAVKAVDPNKVLTYVASYISYCKIDPAWRSSLPLFQQARESLIALNPKIRRLAFINTFTEEPVAGVKPEKDLSILIGVHSGERVIKSATHEQIFETKADGALQPRRSHATGVRVVTEVKEVEGNEVKADAKPVVQVKFLPQKIEEHASLLARRLGSISDCVAWSEFAALRANDGNNIPVTLSQHVEGENLFYVIGDFDRTRKLNELIKENSSKYTKAFLFALLMGPRDGKADGYILTPGGEIVAIDNDLILGDQLIIENNQRKTDIKCVLYLFTQIFQQLDREVCKEFLNLNSMQILDDWNKDLISVEQGVKRLFTEEQIKTLKEVDVDLTMEFSARQYVELTERIKDIQKALSENPEITGIELLERITPAVSVKVREAFAVHPDPVDAKERFKAAWQYQTKRADTSAQANASSQKVPENDSQNEQTAQAETRTKATQALLVTEALINQGRGRASIRQALLNTAKAVRVETLQSEAKISPTTARSVLMSVQTLQQAILKKVVELLAGNMDSFRDIRDAVFKRKILEALTSDILGVQLEKIFSSSTNQLNLAGLRPEIQKSITDNISAIKGKTITDDLGGILRMSIFDCLTPKLQKVILEALNNTPLRILKIPNCSSLTDGMLRIFLKNSEDLRELDISDCPQITESVFPDIVKYCPNLEKLSVRGLKWTFVDGELPNLRRFDGSGSQIKRLRLKAPLKSFLLDDTPVEGIQPIGWQLKDGLSLVGCNKLSDAIIKRIIGSLPNLLARPGLIFLTEEDKKGEKTTDKRFTSSQLVPSRASIIDDQQVGKQATDRRPQATRKIPTKLVVKYAAKYGPSIWTKYLAGEIMQAPAVNLLETGITDEDIRILSKLMPGIPYVDVSGTKVGWQGLLSCVQLTDTKKVSLTDYAKLHRATSMGVPAQDKKDEDKNKKDEKNKAEDITCVTLNNDGQLLVAGKKIWRSDNAKLKTIAKGSETISTFVVLPNGDIVTATSKDGQFKINLLVLESNTSPDKKIKYEASKIGHAHNITGLHYFSNQILVSASEDGTIKAWKLAGGTIKYIKQLANLRTPIYALEPLTDEDFVVVCANGQLVTCNINNWTCSRMQVHESRITAVKKIETDVVAVGGYERRKRGQDEYYVITLFNLITQQPEMTIDAHKSRISRFELLSEGQYFASGAMNGEVKIWEVMTGKCVHAFPGNGQTVKGIKAIGINQVAIVREDGNIEEFKFASKSIELDLLKAYQCSVQAVGANPSNTTPGIIRIPFSNFVDKNNSEILVDEKKVKAFLEQFRNAVLKLVGNSEVTAETENKTNDCYTVEFRTNFLSKFNTISKVLLTLLPSASLQIVDNPSAFALPAYYSPVQTPFPFFNKSMASASIATPTATLQNGTSYQQPQQQSSVVLVPGFVKPTNGIVAQPNFFAAVPQHSNVAPQQAPANFAEPAAPAQFFIPTLGINY